MKKEKPQRSKWRVRLKRPYYDCDCVYFDKQVCNVCQGIREFVIRKEK